MQSLNQVVALWLLSIVTVFLGVFVLYVKLSNE